MRLLIALVSWGLWLGTHCAVAMGPEEVAKADFSLWPHPVTNRGDFNTASRAEILLSALALDRYLNAGIQPADIGVKQIQTNSLEKWESWAKINLERTFHDAAATCTENTLGCGYRGTTWAEFITFAKHFEKILGSDPTYARWLESSRNFYRAYLKEQLRLAALFPTPTSEILTLADSEVTGDKLNDGQFVLSFDDGPTSIGGDTERYVTLLENHRISAFFFVLGGALESRSIKDSAETLRAMYRFQCVGSHGYEHKPHPRMLNWKESVDGTQALITKNFPERKVALFRPPYGQRHPELVKHIDSSGSTIVLWNIDSQDWNSKISALEVAARLKKLMLLKRRGMILFHDTHSKGLVALPDIIAFAATNGLTWTNCGEIGKTN